MNATHVRSIAVTAALMGAGLVGCGGDTPAARNAAPPQAPPAAPNEGRATDVRVQRTVVEACRIPEPHFAFDSAEVRPVAEDRLQKLAECYITGPLAGQDVLLIGYTDPRGPAEYNIALGQQRAGSVADALKKYGVPADRIGTMSQGEFYAKGTEPEGWAEDRHVEIGLRGEQAPCGPQAGEPCSDDHDVGPTVVREGGIRAALWCGRVPQ